MSEHTFPSDEPPHAVPDLLCAAILHHLLTRRPDGASAADLSRALLGAVASPRRDALCAGALARLRRDGLIVVDAGACSATRAARAFHRIMLGSGR